MYVITHNNKPATLEALYDLDNKSTHTLDKWERRGYLASEVAREAIALYIYHFGFTWAERTPGVDVARCTVVEVRKYTGK